MPDADLGNAGSWWRPYTGKYELALTEGVTMDDPTLMLSTILDVMFCGDVSVPGGITTVGTLPEDCRPSKPIYLYAVCDDAGVFTQELLTLAPDGTVTMQAGDAVRTLHLNGASFNICGRYYGKEVAS